jgi:hypothetical protein
MRPVNGFRPGPEDFYGQAPVDSYTRLPPVTNQAYDPPQLRQQRWDGGPVQPASWEGPQQRGPADSYDRLPPAGFAPVNGDSRIRPVRRGPGPEDSYDRLPPARQFGPEDSYDQFPPVRRGPLGPVDSDGRLRPVQRRRY